MDHGEDKKGKKHVICGGKSDVLLELQRFPL